MSTLCKTRRSGLFVPWGRFLLIFGHPQNCKREGGFDPSVFTLSSMFPFLEGKSTNYPALSFLYLLHFSTGPRDHSQNVLEHCEFFGEFSDRPIDFCKIIQFFESHLQFVTFEKLSTRVGMPTSTKAIKFQHIFIKFSHVRLWWLLLTPPKNCS